MPPIESQQPTTLIELFIVGKVFVLNEKTPRAAARNYCTDISGRSE